MKRLRRMLWVCFLSSTVMGFGQTVRFEDMHGRRITDWKPNQKIRVRMTGDEGSRLYGVWWGFQSSAIAPQVLWWGRLGMGETRTIVVTTGPGRGKISCNAGPLDNLRVRDCLLRSQR